MKTSLIVASLLLSVYCFLSVLIQQREITGLESRLHQQVLILANQARIIEGLSATSIATAKNVLTQGEDEGVLIQRIHERDRDIFTQDRRIRDLSAALEELKAKAKPAPIGITPGQGTVRPPDKPLGN